MSETATELTRSRPTAPEARLRFQVTDWMAASPERRGRAAWLDWAGAPAQPAADAAAPVPASLRRRLRQAGLLAAEALFGLAPLTGQPRLVFCSRHGEFQRNLNLLRQLVAEEPLSPTDFSLSVHNAIAGLISIASGNRAGHTAIAAGRESFQAGLLEAAVLVKAAPEQPVVLVHYDEPLPTPFEPFRDPAETPIGLALVLKAAGSGPAVTMTLEPAREEKAGTEPAESPSLAFLRFLLGGADELSLTGRWRTWRWRHAA
ncbi:MAG: beta-ketoacyl synthase chain length factor [Alphaproteobacteria bacterium]|nr:beta-ketoacyl synthase chain length factor [Alphaproteobacteria bacterium]